MGDRRPSWIEALVAMVLLLINITSAQRYGYNMEQSLDVNEAIEAAGSAMFSVGDALYKYGGLSSKHINGSSFFSRLTFNTSNAAELTYQNITSGGTVTRCVQTVPINDDTVLIFATDTRDISALEFTVALYSISQQTWNYPNISSYGIIGSEYFDATLASDGKVYITGGYHLNMTSMYTLPSTQIWSYDPALGTFQSLTAQEYALVRHSGVALPDGSIVYLGGFMLSAVNGASFQSLDSAMIYTPSTDSWSSKKLILPTESPPDVVLPMEQASGFNAVLGPEKRYIYVYGGDNDLFSPNGYIFYNAILVLDTQTWTWIVPKVEGVWPTKRCLTASTLFKDKYFVIAGGTDRKITYYPEVDILLLPPQSATGDFNPEGFKWVVTIDSDHTYQEENAKPFAYTIGTKAGTVLGPILALAIIIFIIYYFRHRLKRFLLNVHYSLWEPRTGEPIWTETLRLVTRVLLIFLFIAFIIILILQVAGSAKATSIMSETSADGSIPTPDVRICTEGYFGSQVTCITSAGISCNQYIEPLNMSVYQPSFAGNFPNVTCYLFMPPSDFTLSETMRPGQNNGFRLNFFVSTQMPAIEGYTHVALYPASRDPNRNTFFHNGTNVPSTLSGDDVKTWKNLDHNNFVTSNILDLEPQSIGSIQYRLIEHQYLIEGDNWNYVGFSQHRNSTEEIQTTMYTSKLYAPDSAREMMTATYFSVQPESYQYTIYREQYLYQLVNVVGYLGGVFSFFIVFQELMFGYRPRSPWGIIHRWSTGNLKRSISRNLRDRFNALDTPVPLVNPVHQRFTPLNVRDYGKNWANDDDSDEERGNRGGGLMNTSPVVEDNDSRRIGQVEERIQLLELLFKSYYVNDEIFRRLDYILRHGPEYSESRPSSSGGTIGKLFRRRPRRDSLDDAGATLGPPTPLALDESEPMYSYGDPQQPGTGRDIDHWAKGVNAATSYANPAQQTPSPAQQYQQTQEKPSMCES